MIEGTDDYEKRLIAAYNRLMNPKYLFKSVREVEQFIDKSDNINDLSAFLRACEAEELYEYCIVINRKIKLLETNGNVAKG